MPWCILPYVPLLREVESIQYSQSPRAELNAIGGVCVCVCVLCPLFLLKADLNETEKKSGVLQEKYTVRQFQSSC